jgi:diacylglycerol O-acyltransferase
VPGPRSRLHLAGHEIDRIMFNVPHPASLGLGVSILSYAGEVRVGARADVAVMPDPGAFVASFGAEAAAL